MHYLSVAEARERSGLRLVLSAYVPGPWGEAAKAVLALRNVAFVPVEQKILEANEELRAWTGVRNAPVAVLDDEPPLDGWLDILLLAERLGSGPSLLPDDPLDRALALGISTEICGPEGFGWSRRLTMVSRLPDAPDSGGRATMVRDYGVRPDAVAQAPARVIAILRGLAAQLHRQAGAGSGDPVGDRVGACDVHWACFSQLLQPLPHADCPMPPGMREMYGSLLPEIAAAADPILIRHRDMIFQRHIGLPLDF